MHVAASGHELPGVGGPGRRRWQPVGWILLAAFVLAGAAGLFGHGPLSRASMSRGDVRVEYERVLRLRAPTAFRVAIARGAPARVQLAVRMEAPWDIELEGVVPEPMRARAGEQGPVYELAAHGGEIRFELRGVPRRPGYTDTRLTIDGAEPFAIRQLVLP